MQSPQIIRGAKRIAHELGVSQSTLSRMVEKGLVPVRKGGCGGRTSPLVIDADALRKPEKD